MISKVGIIAVLFCTGFTAGAQTKAASAAPSASDKYVSAALTYLKANDFDNARQEIDKAFAPTETKSSPKALLAKAQIYFAMNGAEKYKGEGLYKEGTKALFKLADTKPDFQRSVVDQLFLAAAFQYYNDGVKSFNDKRNAETNDLMKQVIKIHDLGGGKRFEKFPLAKQLDTISAEAYFILASTAYSNGKFEDAIPLCIIVKNNPITRTPASFQNLIYAYNLQKNAPKAYEVIEEGRKAYPDDVTLCNYELDYFIENGKKEELLKKADAAIAKYPENANLYFDEAIVYMNMADQPEGKKPAGSVDPFVKSEAAFTHALSIVPDNALYNYSFGTLYYNKASELNDQMNAIKGMSSADMKKQDDLKAKADALLTKAQPYFEKEYSVLAATAGSLVDEDKKAYKATLAALKEIYAAQNKKDKAEDMKRKYDALN